MVSVTITSDNTDADTFCALFPERALRGTVRSVNRAIGAARTVMVRLIAGETGLKSGDVRDKMRMTTATFSKPEAELTTSGKRMPLYLFNARGPVPSRGRGRGVSYRLGSGRGVHPHAFIATVGAGHTGVFVRVGKKRLPIKQLFGPSLPAVFAKFQDRGAARAQEALQTNLEHELGMAAQGLDVSTDLGIPAAGSDE